MDEFSSRPLEIWFKRCVNTPWIFILNARKKSVKIKRQIIREIKNLTFNGPIFAHNNKHIITSTQIWCFFVKSTQFDVFFSLSMDEFSSSPLEIWFKRWVNTPVLSQCLAHYERKTEPCRWECIPTRNFYFWCENRVSHNQATDYPRSKELQFQWTNFHLDHLTFDWREE